MSTSICMTPMTSDSRRQAASSWSSTPWQIQSLLSAQRSFTAWQKLLMVRCKATAPEILAERSFHCSMCIHLDTLLNEAAGSMSCSCLPAADLICRPDLQALWMLEWIGLRGCCLSRCISCAGEFWLTTRAVAQEAQHHTQGSGTGMLQPRTERLCLFCECSWDRVTGSLLQQFPN